MIDREQSAASQTTHNVVPKIVLLKPREYDDPVLVLLGTQQRFTDFEHGVRTHDLGVAEIELDFARSLH
jgi:hypothetical protein